MLAACIAVFFLIPPTCHDVWPMQLLKFAQDLSIDEVEISDCGCLGESTFCKCAEFAQINMR
jgi:hypothetical protein